jgi:hypothetical protein
MKPKILKNDAEYREALDRVSSLKGQEPGPDRDSELELWALLLDRYERSDVKEAPRKIDPWPRSRWPMSMGTLAFFLGTALLLYLRLMYRSSYFPPFYAGEESKVLDLAKSTVDFAAYTGSWWDAFKGGFIEYNKGFAWILVPFYEAFGYDSRLITYVVPVICCVMCATFFTIYRKAYPKAPLLSFVVPILFSVLCVALRRYKWHTAAYITAISVYLYFLPEFYRGAFFLRDVGRKVLAVLLFALSCYLYFGCFLYLLPVFLLVVFFSTKRQRRRELLLGCVGFALFAAAFGGAVRSTADWRMRIDQETGSIMQDFSHDGMLKVWWSLRDFLFTLDLSVPYLVIFVVGIISSFRMIRRGDKFALINTTLFLSIFPFQMAIGGLNNPDQTNWLMVPLFGVLLIGSDKILGLLRDRVLHGQVIAAVLVFFVGWNELHHYLKVSRDTPYQWFVQERNTRTQSALVLRMIRDDNSGSVQYYLPAPAVSEQNGGFEYTPSLLRVDYAKAFQKVIYFNDEDDLRRKLLVQRGGKDAVVYLSVGFPAPGEKDTEKLPLLGKYPEIIHPYEDVYEIPFIVRKYVFSTGPAAAAYASGPGG